MHRILFGLNGSGFQQMKQVFDGYAGAGVRLSLF
jgi:hypothetical protein